MRFLTAFSFLELFFCTIMAEGDRNFSVEMTAGIRWGRATAGSGLTCTPR